MKSPWITCCLLLSTAFSIHAQTLSDQVTVNVVEVPVYVTGLDGPVEGLTRDDFELFVNGKPHPVDYFDVIADAPAPPTAEAAASEAPRDLRRRRLFLLLFDPLNSTMIAVHRAKERAQVFVDSAPPGDVFGVAVARHNRIDFAVPFTSDRIAVKRAIATLQPSLAGDALSLATLERERAAWTPGLVAQGDQLRPETGSLGPAEPAMAGNSLWLRSSPAFDSLQAAAAAEAQMMGGLRRVRTEKWVKILGALADRLGQLEGMKHVVLLREGGGQEGLPNAITSMHDSFKKAGVILDAVDIGGLRAPWGERYDDGMGFLRDLSLETGGMVTTNFEALQNMERITYVLGFVPPSSSKSWNTIDVRLKSKPFGTDVRHRRGYSTDGAREDLSDGLLLADVILNDIPQNDMTVAVNATPTARGVRLAAQVPGVEVLALGQDGSTMLDVFLYVFDERNTVAAWNHARLRVNHERGRAFLAANPYTVRHDFRLGPGRYSAKALLRVVGKDLAGFGRTQFEVTR